LAQNRKGSNICLVAPFSDIAVDQLHKLFLDVRYFQPPQAHLSLFQVMIQAEGSSAQDNVSLLGVCAQACQTSFGTTRLFEALAKQQTQPQTGD
jgi:hypothetical protein